MTPVHGATRGGGAEQTSTVKCVRVGSVRMTATVCKGARVACFPAHSCAEPCEGTASGLLKYMRMLAQGLPVHVETSQAMSA